MADDAHAGARDADTLRRGACDWIARSAGYLDSAAARVDLPAVPRAKALLQLAGLARCWASVRPADPGLAVVAEVLRRAWARDELPAIVAADRGSARQYTLMYVGLAGGVGVPVPEALRSRIVADGWLTRPIRSPYLRLEAAYFAEMAGLDHSCGTWETLSAAGALAADRPPPTTTADACALAHTVFYLADYGLRPPAVDPQARARARAAVEQLIRGAVAGGTWDDVARFVLAQHCLGLDPTGTGSGRAALRALVTAQDPTGSVPGPTADLAPGPAASPVHRFRAAYQVTAMAALAALMVSAPGKPPPPGASAAA